MNIDSISHCKKQGKASYFFLAMRLFIFIFKLCCSGLELFLSAGMYIKVDHDETIAIRDMIATPFSTRTIATPTTRGTSSVIQFGNIGNHQLSADPPREYPQDILASVIASCLFCCSFILVVRPAKESDHYLSEPVLWCIDFIREFAAVFGCISLHVRLRSFVDRWIRFRSCASID